MESGIDIFHLIAERKIKEAMERGEFDNLPLKGQPLDLSFDPLEPPERRLANKVLKNADVLPVEISLRRELDDLKRQMARTRDAREREQLAREVRTMTLRLSVMMKNSVWTDD
jgi:hypothetical protein